MNEKLCEMIEKALESSDVGSGSALIFPWIRICNVINSLSNEKNGMNGTEWNALSNEWNGTQGIEWNALSNEWNGKQGT